MKIRKAALSDSQPIARLSSELGYPSTPKEVESRLRVISEANEHEVFVAAFEEHILVGWVHVFGTHRLEANSFAEIGGLIVDASYRNRGIGKALLLEAEKWTWANGYARLRIRSRTVRQYAHEFYKNMGYQHSKTQHVFEKAGPEA